MKKQKEIFLILENIRSSENVGSIFRTADATRVSKIYLTGYTPTPLDRFKRKNKKIAKTALGAEEIVSWEKWGDTNKLLKELRKNNTNVIAVEQNERSISYREMNREFPLAFIFGNEVRGVEKETLAQSDEIIEIPMAGEKESLNVSVAVGVVLYGIESLQ